MKKILILLIVVIMAAGSLLLKFGKKPQDMMKTQDVRTDLSFLEKVPCEDCNVILISIEPLRLKNMSLYGYNRKTTPNIEKFAENALVFNNFVSVSSWTLPAHMSLFTGVDPSRHKITNKIGLTKNGEEFENSLDKVSPDLMTLPEILKKNGYKTAGFTGGAADASSFGFGKGFDEYVDAGDFVGIDTLAPKAENWIDKNKNNKFFIFLQGYDVHGQYIPSGGYDKRFVDFNYTGKLTGSAVEQKDIREEGITRGQVFLTKDDVRFLRSIYDEKVQRMDSSFGRFMQSLEKEGLLENTIVIFMSSHGDEFYEHGRIDHGHSLYEELVHVPLIVRIPGLSKRVEINSQFSLVDLMPTIFDLIGKPEDADNIKSPDGTSIVELLKEHKEDDFVFMETDYRYSVFKRGVRTADGWKLIKDLETGKVELYDLNTDPGEVENRSDEQPTKYNDLLRVLDKHLNSF